jgi:hypothetical protein
MKNDRVWSLIALRLTGEIKSAEMEELDQLLELNPDLENLMQLISQWCTETYPGNEAEIADAWQRHLQRLQNKEKEGSDAGTNSKI